MTRFSIIIPCFNATATLPQTLDAILSQTYGDWELTCVDDGSSDETWDVIAAYAKRDNRIKGVRNTGKGPSCARNVGLQNQSTDDVIAFCDADDIWGTEKLCQLARAFAVPHVDAVYGKIAFFQDDPAHARVFSNVPTGFLTIPMLLAENPVCTMSNIAVRARVFRATHGFDEIMVHNEDLDWLIRLVGGGARVVGLDLCQTWYRSNGRGLSSDLAAMMSSRSFALESAARFGHVPTSSSNAIYHRYLARRALRLGQGRTLALQLALSGIALSPTGFFSAPKRGALTFLGAVCATFFPQALSRALFSR
jgi:glycosyltransferase involved in cell wall biosynthesis